MRYCYTPTRKLKLNILTMLIIGENMRQIIFAHCWWEYKMLQPLWETFGSCIKTLQCMYHVTQPFCFLAFVPQSQRQEHMST